MPLGLNQGDFGAEVTFPFYKCVALKFALLRKARQSAVGNGDAEYGHRAAATCGLPNHQVLYDKVVAWNGASP